MIWVDSIDSLDYYTHPVNATVPCYCEYLAFPSDLILQASFNNLSTPSIVITVLSPDGLTVYEDATSYFDVVFFTVGNTQYCNMRLKSYSPAMCTYKCWILNVKIDGNYTLFNKYTNRYCQTTCCDIPRLITFEGESAQDNISEVPLQMPTTVCGKPLIRLEVVFDCYDNQLGDYYGIPPGQTWGFKKILNIQGKIEDMERDIVRNISYNCNTQRSESFLPVQVKSQGTGTFPKWKKNEIEAMFHAKTIYITDFKEAYNFQFDGGKVMVGIGGPPLCWHLFQISAIVRTCIIRQTFGCNDTCGDVSQNLTFLVPQNFSGGNFYNENKQNVGDFENLMDWYRNQNGVLGVTDVSSDYDNIYGAFQVLGSSYIPTQFYFDSLNPRNRVFGVPNPVSPVVACQIPVIGTILIEEDICQTPDIGEIEITEVIPETYEIFDYNNWNVEPGTLTGVGKYFRIDLVSTNSDVAMTSPIIFLNMEIIGQVEPSAIPLTQQVIIIDDVNMVSIDTFGSIRYTGYPTSYTEESITVTLSNIYYYGE